MFHRLATPSRLFPSHPGGPGQLDVGLASPCTSSPRHKGHFLAATPYSVVNMDVAPRRKYKK